MKNTNQAGRNAAKSAIIIIIFSLVSKVLGFARESLIGARFGSGMATDAYFLALSATSIVSGLISNAVGTTFIPILAEVEAREGKRRKISHTANMVNIIALAGLILSILAWSIAPALVKLLGIGFTGEKYRLAVSLTRIGAPMILFSGVRGTFTGYLNSEQRHRSTAAVGLPMNIIFIIFLLGLAKNFGITGLMVTGVLAEISQFLILIPEIKESGYKHEKIFNIRDRYIKKVLFLSIPIFIGVAINDLNAIVDKALASVLVEGSISALNYAVKLNNLIQSIFITAITTVIYPILSKECNEKNMDGVKKIIAYGINLILLITIPATVGMVVLAKPIVQIAFERGKFDSVATMMTSQALIFYAVGMVGSSLRLLVTRVYYSLQDTKTPTINSAITVATNIVFNLILIKPLKHGGLALATSISMTVSTLWMYHKLRSKIGNLGLMVHLKSWIQMTISSLVMGAIAYFAYGVLHGLLGGGFILNVLALGLAALLGATIYGLMTYGFKIPIVRDTVDSLAIRVKKKLNR